MRLRLTLAMTGVLTLALPAAAGAGCIRDVRAGEVRRESAPPLRFGDVRPDSGPPLRFGIGPLVQAGQIGVNPSPAVPEQPARTHEALARLRKPGRPFVLRLNRFFWSDRERGFRRYLALARRFARRGYELELQVRYHPDERQEGNIEAWRDHVRAVVRRFGRIRKMVALQITNEVNLTFSPDSSDGAYARARKALVAGVVAAKREARQLRLDHRLKIGFNWFWRLEPATERSFWVSLRRIGGRRFARSVDWLGLDVYPGTVFPTTLRPHGERDAIVTALATLRCFARALGIPRRTPIKIEENGWPTQPPARSYVRQAELLDSMVRTVSRFRGTFGVSDYRWFNLRDGDTGSPMLFQHFGLLESDYDRKPAFGRYRRLVRELG